jgi:hypothetical protein
MPSAFPTDADVPQLLIDTGVLPTGTAALPTSFVGAAAGALLDWERDICCSPWINPASAPGLTTRIFDPPDSRLLTFGGGLISVTTFTVDSVAQVSGTDYWLWPTDAPIHGKPYYGVQFASVCTGLPATVSINGRWGYKLSCETPLVPQDVFDAVCAWAAVACLPTILRLGGQSAVTEEKQGDVSTRYADPTVSGGMQSIGGAAQWELQYQSAVQAYVLRAFV